MLLWFAVGLVLLIVSAPILGWRAHKDGFDFWSTCVALAFFIGIALILGNASTLGAGTPVNDLPIGQAYEVKNVFSDGKDAYLTLQPINGGDYLWFKMSLDKHSLAPESAQVVVMVEINQTHELIKIR